VVPRRDNLKKKKTKTGRGRKGRDYQLLEEKKAQQISTRGGITGKRATVHRKTKARGTPPEKDKSPG